MLEALSATITVPQRTSQHREQQKNKISKAVLDTAELSQAAVRH